MSRILIFSPYQLWGFHTLYEGTIARACRVRGAAVEYLLCDGLPECDQHWDSKANGPRPFDLCQRCKGAAKISLDNLGFPYAWLRSLVSDAERTEAFNWAQTVEPADLGKASFKGNPIGNWVLSTVISYFRRYPPDLGDWHVASVYRGFLFSGAVVATALENYLRVNTVDAALLFNGRQSITRVALEIFRGHGIRVLTHERAEYQRGHINVKPNAHCMSPEPFAALWSMWGQVPLTRSQLEAAFRWLVQRRYGANLAWIPFNKAFSHASGLRKSLKLEEEKRLWVLFTSSSDEVAGDPLMKGPYDSQAEWVREVVQWVGSRNDVQLVIKVHPNLGGNEYIGRAVDELRVYQEMQSSLPANVRMVLPEEPVNAYALAEEADVGLTFGSTIGMEMAMLGKPILLASKALYGQGSKTMKVTSKEVLPKMLQQCLYARPDREIQREAFRVAYYYMFGCEIPFSPISVISLYEGKANYGDDDELFKGRNAYLDRICDYLILGKSLHTSPTAEDLTRSTDDEDVFFSELTKSQSYLRDLRYESWLKLSSLGGLVGRIIRSLPLGSGEALLEISRNRWHAFLKRMERGESATSHD